MTLTTLRLHVKVNSDSTPSTYRIKVNSDSTPSTYRIKVNSDSTPSTYRIRKKHMHTTTLVDYHYDLV